jgi:hypothetical protein
MGGFNALPTCLTCVQACIATLTAASSATTLLQCLTALGSLLHGPTTSSAGGLGRPTSDGSSSLCSGGFVLGTDRQASDWWQADGESASSERQMWQARGRGGVHDTP